MIAVIGLCLVKTLTSYLFGAYLKYHWGSMDLEGAPFWYGREGKDEICVSTFNNGGLDKLDLTKNQAKVKLTKKLSSILEYVTSNDKQFKHLKPDEEEYLENLIKDKKISQFVNLNTYYKNQKIDEDEHRVFVRACVKKDKFIEFEKERVKDLKKNVTFYKGKKAFDELDSDDMKLDDNM